MQSQLYKIALLTAFDVSLVTLTCKMHHALLTFPFVLVQKDRRFQVEIQVALQGRTRPDAAANVISSAALHGVSPQTTTDPDRDTDTTSSTSLLFLSSILIFCDRSYTMNFIHSTLDALRDRYAPVTHTSNFRR